MKSGDDVNFIGIDHVEGFTHGGFFFPEAAVNFGEEFAFSDFRGVIEVGRGGVGVFGPSHGRR